MTPYPLSSALLATVLSFTAPSCRSGEHEHIVQQDFVLQDSIFVLASFWDTKVSTVEQFQCFFHNDESSSTTIVQRHRCCKAIDHLLDFMHSHYRQEQQQQRVQTIHECYNQINTTSLPAVAFEEFANDLSIPRQLWVTESLHSEDTQTTPSLSPPQRWRHFVWDDEQNEGVWMLDNSTLPENISSTSPRLHNFLSQFTMQQAETEELRLLDKKLSSSDDRTIFSPIIVHLNSVLSTTGGMHRRLHHNLQIILNETIMDRTFENISVWVMMHIPSGVFINVEDAFEVVYSGGSPESTAANAMTINLLTNKNVVIDQEEPSFVSPSHTVVYRASFPREIIGSNKAKESLVWNLQWDTLLHVRYPAPLPSGSDDNAFSSWITLLQPTPILVAEVGDRGDIISSVVSTDFINPKTFFSSSTEAPIQFPVATGYASDLIPVLVVTLMTSLLATAWLLTVIWLM